MTLLFLTDTYYMVLAIAFRPANPICSILEAFLRTHTSLCGRWMLLVVDGRCRAYISLEIYANKYSFCFEGQECELELLRAVVVMMLLGSGT